MLDRAWFVVTTVIHMASIQIVAFSDHDTPSKTTKLRNELSTELRPCDTAWLLPGCNASIESSDMKNVVLGLDPTHGSPPLHLFSPDWGHGVSAIRVPAAKVDQLIQDPSRRMRLMEVMKTQIACEITDSSVQVGPKLASHNHQDSHGDNWLVGFDGENCSCGLYYATELRSITGNRNDGMTRPINSYFLVVKAGGGLAAQQFHSELSGFRASGLSLRAMDDEYNLESKMKRVINAGRRNRASILYQLAQTLGLDVEIETLVDHASAPDVQPKKLAILYVDAVTNVLSKTEREDTRDIEWKYYAGCTDPSCSQSSVVCSNMCEGYVLLTTPNQNESLHVRNEAGGALPFSSQRIKRTADALETAVQMHILGRKHPDREWIDAHFTWFRPNLRRIQHLDPRVQACIQQLEPSQLWGTHAPVNYNRWLRPLGAENANVVRLYPMMILLAGNESSILRSVAANVTDQQHTEEQTRSMKQILTTPPPPKTQTPPPTEPDAQDSTSFANKYLSTSPSDANNDQFEDSFMKKFGLAT
jgi:hypothetical protein